MSVSACVTFVYYIILIKFWLIEIFLDYRIFKYTFPGSYMTIYGFGVFQY